MSQILNSISGFLSQILFNEVILGSLYFLAILFGTYSLFLSLLSFAFRSTNAIKGRALPVLAFMISFIGTSGIFFIYGQGNMSNLILLFGGYMGLLFILFLMFFLLRLCHSAGLSIGSGKEGTQKGVGYYVIMTVGVLLSLYLLSGYLSQVLNHPSAHPSFESIKNFVDPIFSFLVSSLILALIVGLFWWVSAGGPQSKAKEESEEEKEIRATAIKVKTGIEEFEKQIKNSKAFLDESTKKLKEIQTKLRGSE